MYFFHKKFIEVGPGILFCIPKDLEKKYSLELNISGVIKLAYYCNFDSMGCRIRIPESIEYSIVIP